MTESTDACAVCGAFDSHGMGMSRVVIEGRALCLCRPHAATVVNEMPATFDEMRALFVGAYMDTQADEERRSPLTRRGDERRVFPPRPEGRRVSTGRRASDPWD
jgi:hypothetical protein